jgi:hypothetical protein
MTVVSAAFIRMTHWPTTPMRVAAKAWLVLRQAHDIERRIRAGALL